MKKTKFLPVVSIMAALALVACVKPQPSSTAKSEPAPVSQQTSEAPVSQPTSTPAPTSTSTPAPTSQTPTSQAPTSSEAPVEDKAIAATAMNIVVENNKAYLVISGTCTNVAATDKFAFGLVTIDDTATGTVAGTWLVGAEEPEDAAYTIVPTINEGAFEAKVDISGIAFVGGVYRVVLGPKGAYGNVQIQSGIGNGDAKIAGYRIYLRSDNGCLAADQLPPVSLTDSYVVEKDGKVYHYIGGAYTMTDAEFLALDPYLMYETTVGNWGQNRMDNKEGMVSLEIKDGKGFVVCDVTDLAENRYNVKVNFNEKKAVDTQLETIVDDADKAVKVGGKAYYVYADKTKAGDKAAIYGNLGLVIEHYHTVVADGEKNGQMQPVKCQDCTAVSGFELHTDDMTSGQVPNFNDGNSRLGKGTIKSDKWNITGAEAGEYEIHVFCAGKDDDSLNSHWDGRIDIANGKPSTYHGGDKAGYRLTFNAGEGYVEPTTKKTHKETGMILADKTTNKYGLTEAIGTIMIPAGATEFEVKNMENGYAFWVQGVQLIKVGAYQAPAKNVAFDNNVMKIEAEDYTTKHTIFTNSGEETDYTTNGTTYPVSLNGSLEEDANASGGKYIHALFREGWNGSKSSNMSGELVYRLKFAEDTTIKIKAKIKSDMETEKVCLDLRIDGAKKTTLNSANEWVEVETAEYVIPAGVHTISFVGQQLGSSEGYKSVLADIDCFDLIKVVA